MPHNYNTVRIEVAEDALIRFIIQMRCFCRSQIVRPIYYVLSILKHFIITPLRNSFLNTIAEKIYEQRTSFNHYLLQIL